MHITITIPFEGTEQVIFDEACAIEPMTEAEFVTARVRMGIHYGVATEARSTVTQVMRIRERDERMRLKL